MDRNYSKKFFFSYKMIFKSVFFSFLVRVEYEATVDSAADIVNRPDIYRSHFCGGKIQTVLRQTEALSTEFRWNFREILHHCNKSCPYGNSKNGSEWEIWVKLVLSNGYKVGLKYLFIYPDSILFTIWNFLQLYHFLPDLSLHTKRRISLYLFSFSGLVKCSTEVHNAQNAAILSDNAVRILPHLMAYNVKNTFVKKLGSLLISIIIRST